MKVYAVTMYRWGERDNHSYMIGVYSKKENAIKAADEERKYRGNKYTAEILELVVDEIKNPTKINDITKIKSIGEFWIENGTAINIK